MGTQTKHDAKSIRQAIESVASSISARYKGSARVLLLGIANGGVEFARRLSEMLPSNGLPATLGTIDISFHRDDIGEHPIPKEFAPTLIPHDVNGAVVILCDDVLHSGRTVKAALDELFEHGRPERVELAVLVDRGGRRLPVAADYRGLLVPAAEGEKVLVQLNERSPRNDRILVTDAPAASKTSSATTTTR